MPRNKWVATKSTNEAKNTGKERRKGKKHKQMKKNMHALREQAELAGHKVAVFFAGVAVSPMMCPDNGQQKDDKKGKP